MNILQRRIMGASTSVPKNADNEPEKRKETDFDLVKDELGKDKPVRSSMQELQGELEALAGQYLKVEQSTSALVYSYGRLLLHYAPVIIANPAAGAPLLLGKASLDLFYRLGVNGGLEALARFIEERAPGYGTGVKQASMALLQLLSFYTNPQAKVGGLAGVALASALSRWVVPKGWDNAQFYVQLLGYICGAEAAQSTFGGGGTTPVQQSAPVDPTACNESTARCDVHWTEAAFATTHNSEALPHDFNAVTIPFVGRISIPVIGKYFANQVHPVRQQLDDGIRGFMLDYGPRDGALVSTHNNVFDYGPFTNVLTELRSFLDQNPREVILLNLENTQGKLAPMTPLIEALHTSGLYAYVPKNSADYTLNMGEMIDRGIRCIVLADGAYDFRPDPGIRSRPANPGQVSSSGTQNSFNPWLGPHSSDCPPQAGVGTPIVLNHLNVFSGLPGGQTVAAEVNKNLESHVENCVTELGRNPTMVAVDHYHHSNVVEVCNDLIPPK